MSRLTSVCFSPTVLCRLLYPHRTPSSDFEARKLSDVFPRSDCSKYVMIVHVYCTPTGVYRVLKNTHPMHVYYTMVLLLFSLH